LKAVILAAGRGERLSPHIDKLPKPLLSVSDKPIIERVISTIKKAGIREFIIVTGYLGDIIQNELKDGKRLGVKISYVHNPNYTLGNASSLLCTEKALQGEESFILTMSDHLLEKTLIEKALNGYQGGSLLCVDRNPRYLIDIGEATKVFVDEDGYIMNIGKTLSEWNGVDTGVFLLGKVIFDVISDADVPPTLSDCMKRLIDKASLRACDVSGLFWLDVDTWEDLEYVRKVVGYRLREED